MNSNDLAFQYRNSQEQPLFINGNTIRVYPSDFGPGCNFENGVEFEAMIVKSLNPSASNIIYVSCSPGAYSDVTFAFTNAYIIPTIENPALTTGLVTGNDGYTITGNTLTVTSDAIGAGKKWAGIPELIAYAESIATSYDTLYVSLPPMTVDDEITITANNLKIIEQVKDTVKGLRIIYPSTLRINTVTGGGWGIATGSASLNVGGHSIFWVDAHNTIATAGTLTSLEVNVYGAGTYDTTLSKLYYFIASGVGNAFTIKAKIDMTDEWKATAGSTALTSVTKTGLSIPVVAGDYLCCATYHNDNDVVACKSVTSSISPTAGLKYVSVGDIETISVGSTLTTTSTINRYLQAKVIVECTSNIFTNNNNSGSGFSTGDIIPIAVPTDSPYWIILEKCKPDDGDRMYFSLIYQQATTGAEIFEKTIDINLATPAIVQRDGSISGAADGTISLPTYVSGDAYDIFININPITGKGICFVCNYINGQGALTGPDSDLRDIKITSITERTLSSLNTPNTLLQKIALTTDSGNIAKVVTCIKPIITISDSYCGNYNEEEGTITNSVGRKLEEGYGLTMPHYIIKAAILGNKLLTDSTWYTAVKTRYDTAADGHDIVAMPFAYHLFLVGTNDMNAIKTDVITKSRELAETLEDMASSAIDNEAIPVLCDQPYFPDTHDVWTSNQRQACLERNKILRSWATSNAIKYAKIQDLVNWATDDTHPLVNVGDVELTKIIGSVIEGKDLV